MELWEGQLTFLSFSVLILKTEINIQQILIKDFFSGLMRAVFGSGYIVENGTGQLL